MNNDKFEDYDLIDLKKNREPESALLADAWAILLRYKFFFCICLLISLASGFFYIRSTPKTFMRTATVMVRDAKRGTGMVESQTFEDMFSLGSNSVENEIGIFKSRRLMYSVAEQLRLDISYRILNMKQNELYSASPIMVRFVDSGEKHSVSMIATLLDMERVELKEFSTEMDTEEKMIVQIGDSVITPVGKIQILLDEEVTSKDIGAAILVSKSPLKRIANAFCHRLKVEVSGNQSSLINLSIVDENPRRAEDVLNTLIDIYNKDAIRDKNMVTVNTANFIDERLAIIENELNLVDSEIEKYKKQHRLTDLSSESGVFLQNSNKLDNDGLSIENQLNMTEYMKSYLLRNNKNSEMIPASIGIADNGIQAQIAEYNELVSKRNRFSANSSERNPLIRDMNATLKSQRNAVLRAIDNLQTSLKLQSINMKSKEQETFDKITNLPTQQKQIVSIERQQKIKEELYLYLLNKKEENELQKTIAESNCKIVDVADGPLAPVAPNKIQVILICLIIGFSVPSLWLYIKSLLNTNVCTKEDIKNKVSIPFLGEVPFDKGKNRKISFIRKGDGHEIVSEALRIVRENLNFMDSNKRQGGKVIQFISFNPGAGKTFIAKSLAINMALSNLKVIVLDLDLRRASLSKRLNIDRKKNGISLYLNGEINEMERLIHTVTIDNVSFDVIPTGVIPPNPAELLKEEKLEKLVETLKEKYDYILFDNPPYGLVVDAFVCSRLADYSVYIIRSGMFDKRLFPDLQELYESKKLKHLSIILNAVDYRELSYSYRYHYGYHYKYGQKYGNESLRKSICRKFFGGKR